MKSLLRIDFTPMMKYNLNPRYKTRKPPEDSTSTSEIYNLLYQFGLTAEGNSFCRLHGVFSQTTTGSPAFPQTYGLSFVAFSCCIPASALAFS